MKAIPLPRTSLPALDPLLNGTLWQRWADSDRVFPLDDVREGISYVRLKPDSSCRLVVLAPGRGSAEDPPPVFLLTLYPTLDRATIAFEKESSRRHLVGSAGYEPFLCSECFVVAVPYPNDPEIPDLRHLYIPDRFRRTLAEILPDYPPEIWRIQRSLTKMELLAYKPGRRAVYRIKVKIRRRVGDEKVRVRLHLKLETPSTCERSYGNLTAVHHAIGPGAGWRVPLPRGLIESRSVVATEWVEGISLAGLAAKGDGADFFGATGRALAGLHNLDLGLDHLLSPIEEGESLIALAGDLIQLLPDEEPRLRELGRSLATGMSRLSLAPSAIAHGDFHLDQVLVSDGMPVIVDLDRTGRGYAACDVGSFLAHGLEREVPADLTDAFLDGYRQVAPHPLADELITITTAAALFRRSVFPFRTLRPDWPQETLERIEQVEELLRRVSL
ncbi:MAG: phosphotransferase enzyme family protein [Planctomycetota bacterium]